MNKNLLYLAVLVGLAACQPQDKAAVIYTTDDGSAFVVGESYRYLGNGKFQHDKVVKWEDLKK